MDDLFAWLTASLAFPASGLWPWWLGALGLAIVAVGFSLALGRPFGVSGAIGRVLDPVRELANDREAAKAARDAAAFARAMAAATAKQFGLAADAGPAAPDSEAEPSAPPRDTWIAQLVFVLSVAIGGAIAALMRGSWGESSYGALFESLLAPGALGLAALFGGGLLVGFGTQMSGGCTSGHGLVGCSRAQGPSLAATAAFFGTSVLVSFLLYWGRS